MTGCTGQRHPASLDNFRRAFDVNTTIVAQTTHKHYQNKFVGCWTKQNRKTQPILFCFNSKCPKYLCLVRKKVVLVRSHEYSNGKSIQVRVQKYQMWKFLLGTYRLEEKLKGCCIVRMGFCREQQSTDMLQLCLWIIYFQTTTPNHIR